MFGSAGSPSKEHPVLVDEEKPSGMNAERIEGESPSPALHQTISNNGQSNGPGNGPGNGPTNANAEAKNATPELSSAEKRRRSSGVAKAKDIFSSAKSSFHIGGTSSQEKLVQTPMQKLSKQDPALGVPQGSLNNSAGESNPSSKSTFRIGVTEDKNKKCRRTMEDTHAYLYNFLSTPAPVLGSAVDDSSSKERLTGDNDSGRGSTHSDAVVETDNGYFAIFDGHAGTFAADWCGKKLHLLLEDTIRKHPNTPIPELLDQTFTLVDQQLEKLPLKNSGTTAVIGVLRWEDRVPSSQSTTGSALLAPVAAAAAARADTPPAGDAGTQDPSPEARLKETATRQRVLYTANVGDARIVLCRNGRALRLSYDHKGSDENEGRRIANAGGLILNNRVNGVLAVTRALGDTYMKDLVTSHPYTTETVIQPEQDEFLILACDGLWDVCSDQEAVDLVRQDHDPQAASKKLVDHALARFSTDNLSCMIVRFDNKGIQRNRAEHAIGVEGDRGSVPVGGVSEAEHIVAESRKHIDETGNAPGHARPVTGTSEEIIAEDREGEAAAKLAEEEEGGPELNEDALKKAQDKAREGQQQQQLAERAVQPKSPAQQKSPTW